MDIEGRGPDGKQYRVEVGVGDTVKDMRRNLEEAAGVRVRRLRLGERVLKEGELCSDVGLAAECVVDFEVGLSREEVERYVKDAQQGVCAEGAPWFEGYPPAVRGEKEVVLVAVREDGDALEFASDDLKADKEVVIEAVKTSNSALEYASEELRADKEVVLAAAEWSGWAVEYAADELKANKEVMMPIVQNNGYVLQFASEELKADREVVLAAVRNNSGALQYAASELKSDEEVLKAAGKRRGR